MTLDLGGRVLPSSGAYTTIFLAGAGAAVLGTVVAALTPSPRGAGSSENAGALVTSTTP
jgi:hypothetical protein